MKYSSLNLIVAGWSFAFAFFAFTSGDIAIGIVDLLLGCINILYWHGVITTE